MVQLLIVDDDRRLRHLLKNFLAESGFETHAASSAAEARSVIATHPIDVMI